MVDSVSVRFKNASVSKKCLWTFLGWRVCRTNFARKIFLVLRNFSRKMLRSFPWKFWAFILWVRKNTPQNSRQISRQKIKKIHRRASAGAQGENIRIQWNAGTACVSECVLKTLACRGLRVGSSKWDSSRPRPKRRPCKPIPLRVVFPTFRLSMNSCVFDHVKLIETD